MCGVLGGCGGLVVAALGALVLAKVLCCAVRWRRACASGYGGEGPWGGHGGRGRCGGGWGAWRGHGAGHGCRGHRWGCGPFGGGAGHGHGHGHEHGPGPAAGPGWFHGFGRGPLLRMIFERLGTTPGQERAIFQALDELQASLEEARPELGRTRRDVAAALRAEAFDEAGLKGAFGRQDAALGGIREQVVAAVKKIHEVLDPRQRELLADLIVRGPFGGGDDGPGPDVI